MTSLAQRFASFTRHSAVRYLFVGALAFLIDIGLLWLLRDVLHWPLWLASGLSFLVGFVFSYTLQRAFSFRSNVPHGRGIIRYLLLLGFNTIATMVIVEFLGHTVLGWAGAKVCATLATTMWNYFLYKSWVFRDRP